MKVLHTIRDTPQNSLGLFALSSSNDNCYLAYPGSNTVGQVQIFDAANLVSSSIFSFLVILSLVFNLKKFLGRVNQHFCFCVYL